MWPQYILHYTPKSLHCESNTFYTVEGDSLACIQVWELATGSDITEFQPLAVSRQLGMQVKGCQG